MTTESERHVPLAGASNFRDFGGYATPAGRVKTGILYRSGQLSGLTPADHATLSRRGIRLVVDLRRDSERGREPSRWTEGRVPVNFRAPLFNDGDGLNTLQRVGGDRQARNDPAASAEIMTDLYRRLIRESFVRRQYRAIFERLAATDGLPVVIHCSAGKDRTGVLAALILGALGVGRDDIVEDYMLTTRFYDGLENLKRRATQVFRYDDASWSTEALVPVFTARPAYIEAALATVDEEFRSVEDFLIRGVGLAKTTLDRLRAELVA